MIRHQKVSHLVLLLLFQTCRRYLWEWVLEYFGKALIASTALVVMLYFPTVCGSQAAVLKHDGAPIPGLNVQETELKLFNLTQLLLQDPQNPAMLMQKGAYLADLGRLVAAFDTFDALRQAFPEQPAPYANLASIYARWGQLEEARQMLLKSDALQANRYQTHLSLASVNLELALASLHKANELKPGDPVAQSKLRALEKFLAESNKAPTPTIVQSEVPTPALSGSAARERIVQSAPTGKTEQAPRPRSSRTSRDRLKLDVFDASKTDLLEELSARAGPSSQSGVSQDPRKPEILKAIEAWSAAWTQQSFDGYLSQYSATFKPSEGATRDAWAHRKRTLMEKAKYIRIDLKISEIKVDGAIATVRLTQKYRSNRYADFGYKELQLKLEDGVWKIIAEKTIKQP